MTLQHAVPQGQDGGIVARVQTTERYLGCKQNLGHPVNDLLDLGVGPKTRQRVLNRLLRR